MPPRVVLFSRYDLATETGGSGKRIKQLVQVLNDAPGMHFAYHHLPAAGIGREYPLLPMLLPQNLLRLTWHVICHLRPWPAKRYLQFLYTSGVSLFAFARHARNADIVILDSPMLFSLLSVLCQKQNIPVVVAPHDIDAFTGNYFRHRAVWRNAAWEFAVLSRASGAISISLEERWLLTNLGIPSTHLLPSPDPESVAFLAHIRSAREARTQFRGVLLLGRAACNKPLLNGMKEFISMWQSSAELTERFGPLWVAGFETEPLAPLCDGTRSIFLGTISSQRYAELMAEVLACACHQSYGAGALTKIADDLNAGVPIVASQHAARSYQRLLGLHILEDLNPDDVAQCLNRVQHSPVAPRPDAPLTPDPQRIANFLTKLLADAARPA